MVTGGQRGRPEGAHLLLPHAPCCCSWRCCCELVLFTSSLLTRGEREGEEGEEDGEGEEEEEEGRRISAASVPRVPFSRLQQTREWLRETRTGKKSARTCSSSSLTISISLVSVSVQQPPAALSHVSVRRADTRGRTLR